MEKQELQLQTINELPAAAESILHFAEDAGNKIFVIYGQMGAGKTTLVKEMCRQLGSHDNFSSPTYSVVNEYLIEGSNEKIYHIDLYRLKNIEEALAIGIEEYLSGENYCFIEWPELIAPLLPSESTKVEIEVQDNMRKIAIFI